MDTDADHTALQAALQQHFGFDGFRPGQLEIIEAIRGGQPVLALMPTGAGKSLCYQLPALMESEGATLVVSPLIALMKDQVDALQARGAPATFINSQLSAEERRRRVEGAREGAYRLIYVAPERFRDPGFVSGMRAVPLRRMAVDEAHCISQWGHDFRPDYRALPDAARALQIPQICAFTATATPEVRRDITRALEMEQTQLFAYGFRRDNLTLRVIQVPRMAVKIEQILGLARHYEAGSGIVYAATRKHVTRVAETLEQAGLSVGAYHAGLAEGARTEVQRRFMAGEARIIVATNAFGMGIDKPDIRFVAHYDVPGSLEAYYQEAGRAGRDGEPAECVVLFNYADVRVHEFFIEQTGTEQRGDGRPQPDADQLSLLRRLERSKLKRMVRYCYADDCRHELILRYFGERSEGGAELCGCCDRCLAHLGEEEPPWLDGVGLPEAPAAGRRAARKSVGVELAQEALPDEDQIVFIQKVLSAFARARGRLSASRIASLLRGTGNQHPQDLLASRSFGLLSGTPAKVIRAVVEELRLRGALRRKGSKEGVYLLTAKGRAVMQREELIPLRLPAAGFGGGGGGGGGGGDEPGDYDAALFEALRAARFELAQRDGVPAYVVAHDRTLKQIAAQRPASMDELLAVAGVGPTKAERYGDELLAVVLSTQEAHELP
jgi:ATP-dependent DNA helicase RecQ